MSSKRKIQAVPSMIPRKYHHEIKCVLEQFQKDILSDILKHPHLDDKAFMQVCGFSDFADVSSGLLKMIKDVEGNDISKRLYDIRSKVK